MSKPLNHDWVSLRQEVRQPLAAPPLSSPEDAAQEHGTYGDKGKLSGCNPDSYAVCGNTLSSRLFRRHS